MKLYYKLFSILFVIYSCHAELNFLHHYSSLQCHRIVLKSFWYDDLLHNLHFLLLSMFKTVVLLNATKTCVQLFTLIRKVIYLLTTVNSTHLNVEAPNMQTYTKIHTVALYYFHVFYVFIPLETVMTGVHCSHCALELYELITCGILQFTRVIYDEWG